MGFISAVQERLKHTDDFTVFKNLLTAYEIASQAGVIYPKVYINLSIKDGFSWPNIERRLPNLFVVRPSVFLNPRFDYFLRDDGQRGIQNYTNNTQQTHQEVFQAQVNNVVELQKAMPIPSLLFEEFPLSDRHKLEYAPHYRVHVFYGEIGLIQVTSGSELFWIDTDQNILLNATNNDVTDLIPSFDETTNLCNAARAMSIQTDQPYIRADFVLSGRGAMFRSFACIPGDVRSEQHNALYVQQDEKLGKMWEAAEQRIATDKDNANADNTQPEPEPQHQLAPTTTPPDDNI